VAARRYVDQAVDGTPLYATRGELPVDVDEQRVQCHQCGGWYRVLGSTHVSRTHGLTADEYRDLLGLRPRHPPWAPDLIEAHSERLHARERGRRRVVRQTTDRAHGATPGRA
jgi:predicted transcriptional regulator